jgi:hypothetical protein
MPFVPDSGSSGGFVPDQPTPQDGQPSQGQQSPDALGPVASSIVRPMAKGANAIFNFIPDTATDIANSIPESVLGPKAQRPGDYINSIIDRYTTAPSTPTGRIAEGVSTLAVAGGGMKAAETGMGLAEKGVKAAYSRITSRAAEKAASAGYKFTPASVGGPVTKQMQTWGGGPKLEKDFSHGNQEVTDRLGKAQLTLAPDAELDEPTLSHLKDEAYQPYQQARALGQIQSDQDYLNELTAAGGRFANRGAGYGSGARFPEVDDEKMAYLVQTHDSNALVDEIRELRNLARKNLGQYNPSANAVGVTQKEIANAMENLLGRQAAKSGNPQLLDQFKAARKALSQIHAVEDSIGAGGHIRAQDLHRMQESGVLLTGNLKLIADTYKNFRKDLQNVAEQGHAGNSGEWSAVDFMLGGTGFLTGHPAVAATGFARPLMRKALRSEAVQKSMLKGMRGGKPSAAGKVIPTPGQTLRGAAVVGAEDNDQENNP